MSRPLRVFYYVGMLAPGEREALGMRPDRRHVRQCRLRVAAPSRAAAARAFGISARTARDYVGEGQSWTPALEAPGKVFVQALNGRLDQIDGAPGYIVREVEAGA